MSTMTLSWFCNKCGRVGSVVVPLNSTERETLAIVADDHDQQGFCSYYPSVVREDSMATESLSAAHSLAPLVIVGITGPDRSGKDTAAAHLVARRGFVRIGLADAVKALLRTLDGTTQDLTKQIQAHGKDHRWAWRQLGTEAREAAGCTGLWVHALLAQVYYLWAIHPEPVSRFVVPDIRFPHEPVMILDRLDVWEHERGAECRFGVLGLERPGTGTIGTHSSETEQRKVKADWRYVNDGTVEELAKTALDFAMSVEKAVNRYRGGD